MISDRKILELLGTCATPFLGRFSALTEVQRKAIIPILDGKDILVASATASGKTEAIVVPIVSRLMRLGQSSHKPAITILIVAPTRALVNDLYKRLEWPLDAIGWRCGRQTSDYSEKRQKPHVLVTTPESFDSMLTYDVEREDSEPIGHLLANVKALFLDEAHLYENSVRGEHVAWLVARLKRLKKFAFFKGWGNSESVQVCAGSATVSHTSDLAMRLLGPKSEIIRVSGDREMHVYTPALPARWTPLESSAGLDKILDLVKPILNSEEIITELIWGSIENASNDGLRKVLIFVPSRKMSDLLSASISSYFGKRRNMYVSGHHGSLDKSKREEAETMFSERRDAVLVATSTLEVGVDIGDVDVIVLFGVPPDTSSLLQRIGRGGRRSGLIKLIPIPANEIDLLAFCSMIFSACKGILEKSPPSRRWSVFVQQTISMIMQAGGKGRKLEDMIELAESVWGSSSIETAKSIVNHLVNEQWLTLSGKRLRLGEKISDDIQSNRAYYLCNFETGSNTLPVVDQLTGQIIGHVKYELRERNQIAIGGHTVDVIHSGNELLVKTHKKEAINTFEYEARAPVVSKSFAEHVRRGLGVQEDATLLVESERLGTVWFHFGGEMYEWVLAKVLKVSQSSQLKQRGLALIGRVQEGDFRKLASDLYKIHDAVEGINKLVAYRMGVGRFHKYLPEHVRTQVTLTMFDVESFLQWAESRKVRQIHPASPLWSKMNSLLTQMNELKKKNSEH